MGAHRSVDVRDDRVHVPRFPKLLEEGLELIQRERLGRLHVRFPRRVRDLDQQLLGGLGVIAGIAIISAARVRGTRRAARLDEAAA